jgi:hypothetical protein
VKQLPTTGISFPTIFNYTRNHIENEMIPSTRKLRNALLKTVSDMNNVEHLRSATEVVYVTNLSPSDENFGKDGTYKALLPTEASAVDKSRDMVHAYNNWIMNWENALKDDEKVQVDADKMARSDQKKYNESFDAGTVKDVTSTTTVTIDHEQLTVIDDYKGYRNESNA